MIIDNVSAVLVDESPVVASFVCSAVVGCVCIVIQIVVDEIGRPRLHLFPGMKFPKVDCVQFYILRSSVDIDSKIRLFNSYRANT